MPCSIEYGIIYEDCTQFAKSSIAGKYSTVEEWGVRGGEDKARYDPPWSVNKIVLFLRLFILETCSLMSCLLTAGLYPICCWVGKSAGCRWVRWYFLEALEFSAFLSLSTDEVSVMFPIEGAQPSAWILCLICLKR